MYILITLRHGHNFIPSVRFKKALPSTIVVSI